MDARRRLVASMVAATVAALLGSNAYSSTLMRLSHAWHLDAARAGWIASAYFVGYACGSAVLVYASRAADSRTIYIAGSALAVAGGAGFATLAAGTGTAMLFQALTGAGLAGVYMPGLWILTERLAAVDAVRITPYYTAAFGIGSSLDYIISGWTAARFGWRTPFLVGAGGSIASALLMLGATAGRAKHIADGPASATTRSESATSIITAYAGHSWEVGALRAWMPTYLLVAFGAGGGSHLAPWLWATMIAAIGVPSSLVGAAFARRHAVIPLVSWYAVAACVTSLVITLGSTIGPAAAAALLCVYSIAINADSGALTALAVATMPGQRQKAVLALYSCIGFLGAAVGPIVTGTALKVGGGFAQQRAWTLAFPVMGMGSAVAAASTWRYHRRCTSISS
jgi:MFS family permease